MEINVSNMSLVSLWICDLRAWPYLLLIKMYTYQKHLFCRIRIFKCRTKKGKAVVGETGVFVFSVTVFDFVKTLSRC